MNENEKFELLMCPDSNFNIYTGWTQEWISSKRLQKDKHLDIQEIVRGPFSSPKLLKTRPFIVFSSCPQQNGKIKKNYCNIRRGIPDTWKEYLACKGFCNTIEKYILQKNLISSCVRYFATDKIWTDTGLHFTQGIPDPWKCKALTTTQCIKYPRTQYSRAKNICSTRMANIYDGDDEAEIELNEQFNKDHIDNKKDSLQEEQNKSNPPISNKEFKILKNNIEEEVKREEKKNTNQLVLDKNSKLVSNQKKHREKIKTENTKFNKTILKPQEIISNKNKKKNSKIQTKRNENKNIKINIDEKQFSSKIHSNNLKIKTNNKKEVQTNPTRVANEAVQTNTIQKEKTKQVQESFFVNQGNPNTVCCNCILQNYILSSMKYFSNFANILKGINLSNHVLCQDCENIYCRNNSKRLISAVKELEFCTPDPEKYSKQKKIYNWTKLKLCTCMQKAKKQFEKRNKLEKCMKTKNSIISKQNLKLICHHCDSPYLKIIKINNANTYDRKTYSCVCKKTLNASKNEQNKTKDYTLQHSIAKRRNRDSKKCYTCNENNKNDLEWTSHLMTTECVKDRIKICDHRFPKKNNYDNNILKLEIPEIRINKEEDIQNCSQIYDGNMIYENIIKMQKMQKNLQCNQLFIDNEKSEKKCRKKILKDKCFNVINTATNTNEEIKVQFSKQIQCSKIDKTLYSITDSGEYADISDNISGI